MPIAWAEVVDSGKRMPFDPPIVVVAMQGNLLADARVIELVDATTAPHWTTRPDEEKWPRR